MGNRQVDLVHGRRRVRLGRPKGLRPFVRDHMQDAGLLVRLRKLQPEAHQQLFQMPGGHGRQQGLRNGTHLHLPAGRQDRHQTADGQVDRIPQGNRRLIQIHRPAQIHQLPRQDGPSVRLRADGGHRLRLRPLRPAACKQGRMRGDRAQDVIEIMSHPLRDPANGLQLA